MQVKEIKNLWVLAAQLIEPNGSWRILYLNEKGLFDLFENAKLFHSNEDLSQVVSNKNPHTTLQWATYQTACAYEFRPTVVG